MSFLDFMKWLIETKPKMFEIVVVFGFIFGLPAVMFMWCSMWSAIGRRK